MHGKIVQARSKYVGVEFETNTSGKCVVIDYFNANNVVVKFYEPHCIVTCKSNSLKGGKVINPLSPTYYNRGYLGIGKYTPKNNRRAYQIWGSMLSRVFCEQVQNRQPTYKDVEVCKEWLNFQNFAAWCESQKFFYSLDQKGKFYQLDKDILFKGNKIYSPETCCFVPQDINNILLTRSASRGKYPLGVTYNKRDGSFRSQIVKYGKNEVLGRFKTVDSAFHTYKVAKESYVKEVANKWKDHIDERVYKVLKAYEVNFED